MDAFLRYSWPGNLRQLNNVLKTAAIMASDGHEVTTMHLADDFLEELSTLITDTAKTPGATAPPALSAQIDQSPASADLSDRWDGSDTPASSAPATMDDLVQLEITTIRRVLEACGGNVSTASKQLNISRNTVYRKLKKAQ